MHKLFSWHQRARWSFHSKADDRVARIAQPLGGRELARVSICIRTGRASPTQGGATPTAPVVTCSVAFLLHHGGMLVAPEDLLQSLN